MKSKIIIIQVLFLFVMVFLMFTTPSLIKIDTATTFGLVLLFIDEAIIVLIAIVGFLKLEGLSE